MPLKKCQEDGKSGWKYGDSGHCYTGPGAKKKAIKQGLAESYRSGEKFEPSARKKGNGSRGKSQADLDAVASRQISKREERLDDLEREMMDRARASRE